MAHKGLGMRTPRTRALELGTAPGGFQDPEAGYNVAAGAPSEWTPGQYESKPEHFVSSPSKSQPSPFKGAK